MGVLLGFILLFLGGIGAIIFSLLAHRLKENIYFILGCVFTGLVLLYILFNWEYIWYMLQSGPSALFGLVILSFVAIPVVFLILSKQKNPSGSGDSDLTDDAFLDEIINAEDEEIDYES